MATAYSEASGSQPYVYLTFTGTGSATEMVYTWSFYYHASYAISTSSGKEVTAWMKGSGQSGSATQIAHNSSYSINGKTGNNLIASGTFIVPRTHSQQTVTGWVEIKFGGVVYSGTTLGTREGKASVTIAAKTSYTVKYDANGGDGAPASQTKWHGESLTLSSVIPTRAGYSFAGWNTAADGSGTAYSAGQTYTGNSALALYAQWTLATVAPRILDVQLYHSDSSKQAEDDGTYLTMVASVVCGADGGGTYQSTAYDIQLGGSSKGSDTLTPDPDTGAAMLSVLLSGSTYSADLTYTATLTLTYSTATATASATAAARFYTLDFKAGGKGVGIGQRATDNGLHVSMPAYFAGYPMPIANYPVASGTSGIWTWMVWADGTAACWGKTSTITTAITTAWGSIYYAGALGSESYPSGLFSSVTYARADWVGESADTWSGEDNNDGTSTTAPPKVYAYSAVRVTSHTGHIRYFAIGKVGSGFTY